MFTVTEISIGKTLLQMREERLTGLRCKISPERINRRIDTEYIPGEVPPGCPFCPDSILNITPTFSNGRRICVGESVTFPNLFPFSEWHTVTVISREHQVDHFEKKQLLDAFTGMIKSLEGVLGYPSINWNYLPSSGASIDHPHLQGMVDRRPPVLAEKYMNGGFSYYTKHGKSYWDAIREKELGGERYLFGDEILWLAHAVPLGEREIRAMLPVSTLHDFEPYLDTFVAGLLDVIKFYRRMGTHAFNISIFFDKKPQPDTFNAFCSVIARINPNPASISDSAFMERVHLEPVILTLPEDLGINWRKEK
ncbi:MAG TPA: galactose-1-phosphate uridylyltransferase [Methanoregulaceae archaeon]|nr:galactose-1-phosphate uridylyltransferase [Methanoregulaceae archaeon]